MLAGVGERVLIWQDSGHIARCVGETLEPVYVSQPRGRLNLEAGNGRDEMG